MKNLYIIIRKAKIDSNFIAFFCIIILGPSLLDGVVRVLLIIELATDLGKSFHEANLLMKIPYSET